jgi:lysozyme
MNVSTTGINLIKNFEGCRLTAYKCPAGVWTIGYGHTGNDVKEGLKITQEQAEEYLKKDLNSFELAVNNSVKITLSQSQFDALVSFSYNVGTGALKKSTLLKLLNKGNYKGAAEEFDKWIFAGGKKLSGLVKRRKAEKELFLKNMRYRKYKVTASVLNVREGAGTKFKVVNQLKKDYIVTLSGTNNGWGKLADLSGWVSMKYLQVL